MQLGRVAKPRSSPELFDAVSEGGTCRAHAGFGGERSGALLTKGRGEKRSRSPNTSQHDTLCIVCNDRVPSLTPR